MLKNLSVSMAANFVSKISVGLAMLVFSQTALSLVTPMDFSLEYSNGNRSVQFAGSSKTDVYIQMNIYLGGKPAGIIGLIETAVFAGVTPPDGTSVPVHLDVGESDVRVQLSGVAVDPAVLARLEIDLFEFLRDSTIPGGFIELTRGFTSADQQVFAQIGLTVPPPYVDVDARYITFRNGSFLGLILADAIEWIVRIEQAPPIVPQ